MSAPFFSSLERIARLHAAADSWLNTPYVQTGAVKGNGASCHMLTTSVLIEAGCPLTDIPERGLTRLREYLATMRTWLDGHPEMFRTIAIDDRPIAEQLQPGDVLLCVIGIGHIALYIGNPGARALQVLRQAPAHYVSLNDPNVRERILAAYRPLEASHG